MENNILKENIRKSVKEKIAISNIRKDFDMEKTNNRKVLNIAAICLVVILAGALSTKIYAKINWDIKFKEFQNREYINGTGTVKEAFENGYGENINMEYVEQDEINVKLDSLIITDDYFASNVNFEFPEGTILNSETFGFGYAVYDEDNNIYVVSSRWRYHAPKAETYWKYLYKEIGKDSQVIECLCDTSGITNIKSEGNNIISELKLTSQIGFPKSKKIYIRIFDLGYSMADLAENYQESTFEDFTISDAEWIFELDVPEKFYERQVEKFRLNDNIPNVENIEISASEVNTVMKIRCDKLIEMLNNGINMNGNEFEKIRKESIYITDENGEVYYDNSMSANGEEQVIIIVYPISKDMLNKKFFLNLKLDGELYTRQIQKI